MDFVSQFSRSVMSDSLRPHELQHARPPCPSPAPGVHPNSRPSSPWCHPAISSSVVPFSSCPQSLPASESFPMSQLFTWGGQSTGVSALASVLPKKSQGWSPLQWTGWISLLSKGLPRVFSNTTVQRHQFFSTQPSLWSDSHICTWLLEKPELWPIGTFDESERGEWKVGLKLNIQKTKIMASGPITSWQIDGRNSGNSVRLYFFGLQNHCRWWLQPWN